MRVISQKLLQDFWTEHPGSEAWLRQWFKVARAAAWKDLSEVRHIYSHADGVRSRQGTLTVFNVGGNKYRLIVRTRYDWQLINVRAILTHAQYARNTWRD